jgi:hypothetical protein
MAPRDYNPSDFDASSVKLDRFMKAATDQIGVKYQFGAEASVDDAHPAAFDSSELVEWAAHQAGMPDMPDGSWNQYRYLHDQGATVSFDEAMHTRGALVFGFSSDPLESSDRPARAYVGISLGNGKVLDISERGGQVKEMDPGGFYSYGAKIPEFHAPDDSVPPDDPFAPSQDPSHEPAKSYSPDGHIIHEDLPAPTDTTDPTSPLYIPGAGPSQPPDATTPAPSDATPSDTSTPSDPQVSTPDNPEDNVCYPDDDQTDTPQVSTPDNPEDDVCYPDDDNVGPLSQDDASYEQGGDFAYANDASTYDNGDAYATDSYASASDSYGSYAGDSYANAGDSYGSDGDSYGSDTYASNDSYGGDSYTGDAGDSYGGDDSSYSDMTTSDA